MTTGGLLLMTASVSAVTLLFVWCIAKVLRTPDEQDKP